MSQVKNYFRPVFVYFPAFGKGRDRFACFGIVFGQPLEQSERDSRFILIVGNLRIDRFRFRTRYVTQEVLAGRLRLTAERFVSCRSDAACRYQAPDDDESSCEPRARIPHVDALRFCRTLKSYHDSGTSSTVSESYYWIFSEIRRSSMNTASTWACVLAKSLDVSIRKSAYFFFSSCGSCELILCSAASRVNPFRDISRSS